MLVLASASPRRRELLAQAGLHFICRSADVDESLHAGEAPAETVRRLARAKAAAVAPEFPHQTILGADTLVVLAGEPLGKPASLTAAHAMLRRLAGRTHQVMTGVCLLRLQPPHEESWTTLTEVTFRPLDDAAIAEYLRRVHVLDKAGAYAIQEEGDRLVAAVRGPRSNVIGLPVEELLRRLRPG
ncbi:MAG: nucleoside triphosphate pyrophosphatase [Lentisphaeria bacterium]|jgi:septum formation protein